MGQLLLAKRAFVTPVAARTEALTPGLAASPPLPREMMNLDLWKENVTSGAPWVLRHRRRIGGPCHLNDCAEEVTELHTLACTRTRRGSISPDDILNKVAICRHFPISTEDTTPPDREGKNRLGSLRMDKVMS